MKRSLALVSLGPLILLASCGVAPTVTTVDELKSYCLGVSVNQAVQMQFQDYELDELEAGLNAGSPVDQTLTQYKQDSLQAIEDYRILKDENNFVNLANSLSNFNNHCAVLIS
ncbi:MAG: hypothetical protein RJA33_1109 [Actinomycetota bacterium]|jgi:hypothetical protein